MSPLHRALPKETDELIITAIEEEDYFPGFGGAERFIQISFNLFPESVLSAIFRVANAFISNDIYTLSWEKSFPSWEKHFDKTPEIEVTACLRRNAYPQFIIILDKVMYTLTQRAILQGVLPCAERVTYSLTHHGDRYSLSCRMVISPPGVLSAIHRRWMHPSPKGDPQHAYEAIHELGRIFPVLSYFPPPPPSMDRPRSSSDRGSEDK